MARQLMPKEERMDDHPTRRSPGRTFRVVRGAGRVTLDISWTRKDFRAARAEMLRIAAAVEERSGEERWVVEPEQNVGPLGGGRVSCSVAIELAGGGAGEGERAEAVLRDVVRERTSSR